MFKSEEKGCVWRCQGFGDKAAVKCSGFGSQDCHENCDRFIVEDWLQDEDYEEEGKE